MKRISTWHRTWGLAAALVAAVITNLPAQAQTFTTLHNFDGWDGVEPTAGLIQASDGNLYGTTVSGGANNFGSVFNITPGGTLTTLHSFDGTDGGDPGANLVQRAVGHLYGTSAAIGSNGTVFELVPRSEYFTTLHSFDGTDGQQPEGALIEAINGDLYGTTIYGGAHNDGTVFKITSTGTLTTVHSFRGSDGRQPEAGLVQARNGNLYGTTALGGAKNYGTVFELTPAGKLTTLHSFDGTHGKYPVATLIQATDGNLYGTTSGGLNGGGVGTVFKITLSGALTTLHTFCAEPICYDGKAPLEAPLVQANDGNFYGVTTQGGSNDSNCEGVGCGTIFKITPTGVLTTLYSFCSLTACTDGTFPVGLVQHTDGTFYGTTEDVGCNLGCGPKYGTVFSLFVGLGSFVETQTTLGKVGATVQILGNNLGGASLVTFNGEAASFEASSTGTEISATVPIGATTGLVQVVTPSGTLTSNAVFTVKR
jgi:uncharacterized repeat protein (TIGR03803 family)